jgi:hypothetical protein
VKPGNVLELQVISNNETSSALKYGYKYNELEKMLLCKEICKTSKTKEA